MRGQGERIGQATTDLNQVLTALNDRSETIRQDWRSFKNFNDTYAAAAQDILTVLDAASTTSATVVQPSDVPGQLAAQRHRLLERRDQPARREQATVSSHQPTFSSRRRTCCSSTAPPSYTCLLQGADE